MIIVTYQSGIPRLLGATIPERRDVSEFDLFRQADIISIRSFMEVHRRFLAGRVLDFGAGKEGTCRQPQPYRDLVLGEYCPYDRGDDLPAGRFDAAMCNQVMEYVPSPDGLLLVLAGYLKRSGHLVLTYKTNWEECEPEDLWRFTKTGMEELLKRAGFEIIVHERRAEIELNGFRLATGYGVVARLV